jgi:GNAT superfamily N-acetyltransferase
MGARWGEIWARLRAYRPKIGTAFLTYVSLRDHVPKGGTTERYRFHEVTSGSDPMLARFAPRWQQRQTRPLLDEGAWYALVALDGDDVVGHVWVASDKVRGVANGVINVELCEGECYAFDLYLHPDHRRASLGSEIGDRLIQTFVDRGYEYAYTHVLFTNAGSVLWHHAFGFNWVQVFNFLTIGPRIWWCLPFGAAPRFGPLSRRGRHSEDHPDPPFGGAMIPH